MSTTEEVAGSQRAGYLAPPAIDAVVEQMFKSDIELQGYIANHTRVWAHLPESLAVLSYALQRAIETAGLDGRTRTLLVVACAGALGDSYCSLAFGSKLARSAGDDVAVAALSGDVDDLSEADRVLIRWARRMARNPNATTPAHVDELRAIGYDDRQIFAITLFVSLRIAFSAVNDTLGALPDAELMDRVPDAIVGAVPFGRKPEGAEHSRAV